MAIKAYKVGNFVQIAIVFLWFAALLMLALSTPSLDYPAYEAKVEKIISNPADIAACEAAALLGDTSCVKKFYAHRAWETWQWYVLYFTLAWLVVETFFIMFHLMFQKYGWTFFVMLPFLIVGFVWLVVVIIQTTIYWVNCADHSACSNARFVYDFTGEVKQTTATWWIVHMVAYYVLFLCHIALFVAIISTQACLSRATHGRETGLDPLFTEKDREIINSANKPVNTDIGDSSLSGVFANKVK